MIKVSDYVMDFLVQRGVDHLFLVTGGGIMHLVDSAGRKSGLRYVCNYHEQACAIAAEAYARRRNALGACLVTTGPGSTNALSGIAGAWVDSVPVMVISGQVRRDLIADYGKVRQYGPQEINIIDMARPVTKYATTVMDPAQIGFELEKAYAIAIGGRPGPVWINLPLDVQGALIDPAGMATYVPEPPPTWPTLSADIDRAMAMLRSASRPLWLCGSGIHLAGADDDMRLLIERSGFPAVFTIGGLDLLEETHPLNIGRFGPLGQRRANFTVQSADLIIAVGASLSVASIGFNTAGFAPRAQKIVVNVDLAELDKPNLRPDLRIHSDLRAFIHDMTARVEREPPRIASKWITTVREWKERYRTVTPDYLEDEEHVNSYLVADRLSDLLDEHDTVLTGNSLDAGAILHSFRARRGQRAFTNINYGSMGWDLPAAVGACCATGGRRTILLTGDGSLQFNVQEMLTIKQYSLPVKVLVINNRGYESIRTTQTNYFGGHFVGADPSSGIGNPDFRALALAYGFEYLHIRNNTGLDAALARAIATPGPVLVELNVAFDQPRSPKLTSERRPDGSMVTRPLHDQFPFLPREEIESILNAFDDAEPKR